MANSDAMALTRYLGALGLEVGADHLLHCLGMALSGPPADSADELVPALNALSGPGGAIETVRPPAFKPSVQPRSDGAVVRAADIVRLVREAGGALRRRHGVLVLGSGARCRAFTGNCGLRVLDDQAERQYQRA